MPPPAYQTTVEDSCYGFHFETSGNQDIHTPTTVSMPPKSHGILTSASCGGSITPASRGGSIAPASRGGSVAPASHGRSIAPASRGRSVAPASHGRSIAPASRGRFITLASHGGSVALASRDGSVTPAFHGGSVAPASHGGSVAPTSHGSMPPVSHSVPISRGGSTAPSSRAVSGLNFRSRFVPASQGAPTDAAFSFVNGLSTYIPTPATTGTLQQNTSFNTSPNVAALHPSPPFDFNFDDYESQVPDEWYYNRAMARGDHFPIEGTHIEQPNVSVLLISYLPSDILLDRIWILMRYLLMKMIGQPKV